MPRYFTLNPSLKPRHPRLHPHPHPHPHPTPTLILTPGAARAADLSIDPAKGGRQ